MFTPHVPLEAAEPKLDDALAAVAEPLVQEEYVYLLRIFDLHPVVVIPPKAKIPIFEFPAADP